MQRFLAWVLTIFSVSSLLSGCAGVKSPSEKVAGQFMDHYYVQTNLRTALQDCDGFAKEKVQQSLQLTEGQVMDDSTHHPRISYKPLESQIQEGEASYLYLVLIEGPNMRPMRRKTLLKVRQRGGGGWKVTQFSDYEVEPEVP